MDRYTKVVLTLIALALWANLFVSLAPPGNGLIRNANAQALNRVFIAGVENGALPVQVMPGQPAPVYLASPPNPANTLVLPVNLTQIGARSFQQGVALPVDIEGIAGAAVKASGGLPVALASTQPLAVTVKEPLAVTSRDPLQVVVTRLPVSPAAVPNQYSGTSSSATAPPPAAGPGGM